MGKIQLLKLIHKYLDYHNRYYSGGCNVICYLLSIIVILLKIYSFIAHIDIAPFEFNFDIRIHYGNFTPTYTFDGANRLCIMFDCQYIDSSAISKGD